MTVAELIQELSRLQQDKVVYLEHQDGTLSEASKVDYDLLVNGRPGIVDRIVAGKNGVVIS